MMVFLCGSMDFYPKLIEVSRKLEQLGHQVEIPISAKMMVEENNFSAQDFKNKYTSKEKKKFFRLNLSNIEKSDAVLIINESKNGIPGYLGTSVIMEIGISFYLNKKIYLLNKLADDAPYKPEVQSFDVEVINNDLGKIHV
ncbi:MAG: hypothetical protein E6P95_04110 [Candidatus Moraniibacteriota bacterium]|nr:MAG: hypothetical protein E6P95_04110 [Candidatus Moranbacteria bacterium]